jgi:nucleoside-triphosphatase THEP1
VGKTTVCRKAVARAQRKGYRCAGILTLAGDGIRVVVDVSTGRQRHLTQPPDEERAVIQGRFRFDPQTLSWGNAVLSQATPCDVLVIDEIGPLEMERGKGWESALDVLRAGGYALGLPVVRPELIARVCDELADHDAPDVLRVTRETREGLPADLVKMVEREMRSACGDQVSASH